MPVAQDLQNVVGDLSAAIAERQSFGRTELEQLRRSIRAIAEDAGRAERGTTSIRDAFDRLAVGIEAGVADLTGLARRAREQAEAR